MRYQINKVYEEAVKCAEGAAVPYIGMVGALTCLGAIVGFGSCVYDTVTSRDKEEPTPVVKTIEKIVRAMH